MAVIRLNPEKSVSILNMLKDLGITILIDDFGTGYSSLSYIKSLPLDTLKIDKSFVSDMIEDRDDVAIVRAIITMASQLGLPVWTTLAGQRRRGRCYSATVLQL